VFPISNWTELDIWAYIERERIDLPSIYYAHERDVFEREGMLMSVTPWTPAREGETVTTELVRYRTVGDATCTGAVRSAASNPRQVFTEVAAATVSERGASRADDRASEAAMEDRKRQGYF
jgi:sulfate adenylyltransferase subunit 2